MRISDWSSDVCSSDPSWIIFHLNPKARWHDGEPVTADDVIFSFRTLVEKGHPQYRFYYQSVTDVEKLDERSVKLTFEAGENGELPLIIGQIQVLPKHYWESRDFTAANLQQPHGSGTYGTEAHKSELQTLMR